MSALPGKAPVAIPSGTITFAFTDIEGSTQRWDRDRFAMQEAVRRHDALMRRAIAAHQGHVFKTIGDAFCAAFSKPEDAVAAMFDAQRALAAEDFSAIGGLRVRAAIHTGTADERDADYYGPAVNRVARLLSITYGGQVLLSGVTTDLVHGSLPPDASVRDLGEHRLKDLSRPEHVFQLLGPDLIADFPPLKSLGTLPNNLPPQLKSFVSRDAEIAEITALVQQHRIVTIVGSGGVGKSSTSLRVAANLLDGSGDGVWFIELAPLSKGDYIPSAVAQTMGLRLASDGDPVADLVTALASKRALLIFDNCEHLVEEAARVIARVIRGCPGISVLASSRQGLGLEGEMRYRMPSLGLPDGPEISKLTAADATRYPAIALFLDRARASDPQFTLTDENAPIVADLCRHLDGIALAIELAAARIKMLSPTQLRDRLSERFRVLTTGSRDALPRQQTLRALIDWSYDLLDDRERRLFRRIGIFVSGFTLDGAVAVGSDDLDEFEVLDVVATLVDKSLVLAERSGETVRYQLLESTRAYATEKLTEAGEREAIASRHLRYFHDRFGRLQADLERSRRSAYKARAFETELDDLRAALDWALVGANVRAGAELMVAIEREWVPAGMKREGIDRLETFIAALPANESLLIARLYGITSALHLDGALAFEAAQRALAHARASGDATTIAFALQWVAQGRLLLGQPEDAEAPLREAETTPGLSSRMRASLLELRGHLSLQTGDLDAAARAFERQRDDARALGNIFSERGRTYDLADIEFRRGHKIRAIDMLRDLLPALRSDRDKVIYSAVQQRLAAFYTERGDLARATAAANDCIVARSSTDADDFTTLLAIEALALVAALEGDLDRAARLAGYADAALTHISHKREFAEEGGHERLRTLLREKLAAADLARLTAEGTALSLPAAIALAQGGKSA